MVHQSWIQPVSAWAWLTLSLTMTLPGPRVGQTYYLLPPEVGIHSALPSCHLRSSPSALLQRRCRERRFNCVHTCSHISMFVNMR